MGKNDDKMGAVLREPAPSVVTQDYTAQCC